MLFPSLLYVTSCWCLTLWCTLFGSHPVVVCFPPFVLQEERHQEVHTGQWTQTQGPTARPKYLATWHWPSDCFPTVQKRKFRTPTPFVPYLQALTVSPDPQYDPLDSWWRRDRLIEAGTYRVLPSAGLMIKAIFLFPPHSISTIFIQLWWAKKTKILAETVDAIP